jgi:atypical dual specificity phosphatase
VHDDTAADQMVMSFSWVVRGRLAGCRGPQTAEQLGWLRAWGIRALVRLAFDVETGMSSERVRQAGLIECYEPVPDAGAPDQAQIDRIVGFVRAHVAAGDPVAVSCRAGYGRTGTILACYFAAEGRSGQDAVDHLIMLRPWCREILYVPEQKEAVLEFARRVQRGEWSS